MRPLMCPNPTSRSIPRPIRRERSNRETKETHPHGMLRATVPWALTSRTVWERAPAALRLGKNDEAIGNLQRVLGLIPDFKSELPAGEFVDFETELYCSLALASMRGKRRRQAAFDLPLDKYWSKLWRASSTAANWHRYNRENGATTRPFTSLVLIHKSTRPSLLCA